MFSLSLRMRASLHQCKLCRALTKTCGIPSGIKFSSKVSDPVQVQPPQGSDERHDEDNSQEEKNIEPDLTVITDNKMDIQPSLKTISVIPGKGPPPEPPVTCCMSGCSNCVWIAYAEELKAYYGDGGEMARKALDHIEDPSLKAFVKLELGIK